MVLLALRVQERDVVGLGEVLPEEVRGSALQRLRVAHQRLDRQRLDALRGIARCGDFRPGSTGMASTSSATSR